jgi:hypothetical protein
MSLPAFELGLWNAWRARLVFKRKFLILFSLDIGGGLVG